MYTLAYVSPRERHHDLELATSSIELRQAHPAVDHRVAGGADADETTQSLRHRLVLSDVTVRTTWFPAANAVELTWSTRPLVLAPSRFEEGTKVSAEDQDRPPAVAGRKSASQPLAHSVSVNAQEPGDFFHRVVEVGLDEPEIRAVP